MNAGICAVLFLLICSHVSAKHGVLTFEDIAEGGDGANVFRTTVRSAKVIRPPKEYLVLGQGKSGNRTHPSVPYIVVDAPAGKHLRPRRFGPYARARWYVYIYELPAGYRNIRVGLPSFGFCGSHRAAKAVVSSGVRCVAAPFRRRAACPKRFFANICRRECGRNDYCRYRCSVRFSKKRCVEDCESSYLVAGIVSAKSTVPLKIIPEGTKFRSFTPCSAREFARHFPKQ